MSSAVPTPSESVRGHVLYTWKCVHSVAFMFNVLTAAKTKKIKQAPRNGEGQDDRTKTL